MSYPLRSCHRCGKGFFSSYKEHICQDCLKDLGWEPTQYTNADHIRYMTDEELAEFLHDAMLPHAYWMDWLKQPYKEE